MRFEYLQEYITLCETLNFTISANKLFITQSALSRHIIAIEEDMGVKLLERDTHSVRLTEAGKYVLEEFRKILKTYHTVKRQAASIAETSSYHLSIGMLYYAIEDYVSPVLKRFKRKFPQVKFSLLSYQPSPLITDLLQDIIDLGLVFRFPFPHQDMVRLHTIRREPFAIMIEATNPLSQNQHISINSVRRLPVVFSKMDKGMSDFIKALLIEHDFDPEHFVETDHVDTLSLAIKETGGFSIIPMHLKTSMNIPGICFLDIIDEERFSFEMCWAYKLENSNPAIPMFLECVDLR